MMSSFTYSSNSWRLAGCNNYHWGWIYALQTGRGRDAHAPSGCATTTIEVGIFGVLMNNCNLCRINNLYFGTLLLFFYFACMFLALLVIAYSYEQEFVSMLFHLINIFLFPYLFNSSFGSLVYFQFNNQGRTGNTGSWK